MSTIMDDLETRLGARVKIEREARGWSLTDLAQRSGVSRAMINKVERGEASPTASLLGRLSGAFGLTLSTLLARTETNRAGRLVRAGDQARWTDPATGY
ncbi:MAG: helix-turn-helix transcriptional regulator, partial [Alphaproteobacteria bacterium]|nr:helix-turn-helix transcriptional regulator [Alphaproteobacteria bacterium]